MTELLPRDEVHTHVVADALRRFGLRIALAVVVVAVIVGGYAYFGPHKYQATATVLLRPLSGNALSAQTSTSSQSSTVAMETEASLVTSLAVTQRVNDALGTDLKAGGGGGVSSSVPPNSQIVKIKYIARTARDAQRRAQAFAQAFLDYRSDLATQALKAQLDRLNARAASVQRQLQQALKDKASKNPPEDADTRVRLYTSNYASLQSEIGQVQAASTESGNVVTPAALPRAPTGLSPALLTGGGALVALLVATAIAIWRERTDDRIRARAEVTVLGLPVLAMLPDADPRSRRTAKRTVADPARTEALRRARTSLLALTPLDSIIAVAGLTDGEPAATVAADLAGTLASAGYQITLVDAAAADEPRSSRLIGGAGLSDLLSIDGPLPAELPLRTVDGVQVLGAGSEPAGASERYAGHRTRSLLQRLQENADYVLVATAPADTSEGMAVLLAANGVVLIVTDRVSTHTQLAATTTAAQRLGATVLGLVVREGNDRHSAGKPARQPVPAAAVSVDERRIEPDRIENRRRAQHTTPRSRAQGAAGAGTSTEVGVGIMDDPDNDDEGPDSAAEDDAVSDDAAATDEGRADDGATADAITEDADDDDGASDEAAGVEATGRNAAADRDESADAAGDETADTHGRGAAGDVGQPADLDAGGPNGIDGAGPGAATPTEAAVNHQGVGVPAATGRQRKRMRNRRNVARIANQGMGSRPEQDG